MHDDQWINSVNPFFCLFRMDVPRFVRAEAVLAASPNFFGRCLIEVPLISFSESFQIVARDHEPISTARESQLFITFYTVAAESKMPAP